MKCSFLNIKMLGIGTGLISVQNLEGHFYLFLAFLLKIKPVCFKNFLDSILSRGSEQTWSLSLCTRLH